MNSHSFSDQTTANPADTSRRSYSDPHSASDRYQDFFFALLNENLSDESLNFIVDGKPQRIGRADSDKDTLTITVTDKDIFRQVVCHANLGLGEAYMAGQFSVSGQRLPELLTILLRSRLDRKIKSNIRHIARYGFVRLLNVLHKKSQNVRRHYDIGDDLFDAFLEDTSQVYSCGYAHSDDDDIETLQYNKMDRICQKIRLEPDHHLLDIGCGMGGLLIHAATHYGVSGVGITNSKSHQKRAVERIEALGLSNRIAVTLNDFKKIEGRFDRVVSVGMLEHVPPREYSNYFDVIKTVLRQDGWGLVHAIGLNDSRDGHDPFIQKYIFPGSDTPRLSTVSRHLEDRDLATIDVENIARHYAVTTRRWLEAFRRQQGQLDITRYDAAFLRMWEYYLSCGIAVALAGNLAVHQVLFTPNYQAELPYQRV